MDHGLGYIVILVTKAQFSTTAASQEVSRNNATQYCWTIENKNATAKSEILISVEL